MIILETERLLFRPLALSDLDDLTALYADAEVMRFLNGPRSREEVQRVLAGYIRLSDLWAFVLCHHSQKRATFYRALWIAKSGGQWAVRDRTGLCLSKNI